MDVKTSHICGKIILDILKVPIYDFYPMKYKTKM